MLSGRKRRRLDVSQGPCIGGGRMCTQKNLIWMMDPYKLIYLDARMGFMKSEIYSKDIKDILCSMN
jgi:hypothetical protein